MSKTYDELALDIAALNLAISRGERDRATMVAELAELQKQQYRAMSAKRVPQNHVTYVSARDGERADLLRKAIDYLDRKLADRPNLDPHRTSVMQGDRDRYAAELERLEPSLVQPVRFDVEAVENRISSLSATAFDRLAEPDVIAEQSVFGTPAEAKTLITSMKSQLLSIGTPDHIEMHPQVAVDCLVEDGMTKEDAEKFISELPKEDKPVADITDATTGESDDIPF